MADRTCRTCGEDISELHGLAERCVKCRCGHPERHCLTCGADISERHANAKFCSEHQPKAPAPRKPRACIRCGADISHTHGLNKRCDDCKVAMMREVGLEPLEPFPGPRAPWKSRCTRCDTDVEPQFSNIANGWGGCHVCGSAASIDRKRLDETGAIAVLAEAGLEPLEPYRTVMTPWRCRCLACGEVVTPLLNNLKKGQRGCVWCSQKAVDPEEAASVMRAAGLEPLAPYIRRHAPWPCRCTKCEGTVSPTYGAVCYGGGCGNCSFGGFDSEKPALVYLITHAGYGTVKVGIMSEGSGRLLAHKRYGWQIAATVRVPGNVAPRIEDAILVWWRTDLGLPPYLSRTEMPQGGWTETVDASGIDLAATIARIRELAI